MTVGGRPTTTDESPDDRRQTSSAFRLRFRQNESVGDATRRVLSALTDEMLGYLTSADAADVDADPGVSVDVAIHEIRRGGKQARALLRLVRSAIGDQFGEFDRRYRTVGRLFADARDARIVVEALDELSFDQEGRVRSTLAERANAEAARVLGSEDSVALEAERVLGETAKLVSLLRVEEESAAIIEGVMASYQAGSRACRMASGSRSFEDFHEWRKRAKEYRHQIAFLWDSRPLDPQDHDRLYELSDLLGAAHDLVVVRDHLVELTGESVADVLGVVDDRRMLLEGEALKLGSQLYARGPEDLGRQFADRWNDWYSFS